MRISSAFDAGAIEVLELDDPQNIRLRLRADNAADFCQWFHFRLLDAAPTATSGAIFTTVGLGRSSRLASL